MPGLDPKQVIKDYLGAPSVLISDTPDPQGSGWHSRQSRGGMGADVATLRFIKDTLMSQSWKHIEGRISG